MLVPLLLVSSSTFSPIHLLGLADSILCRCSSAEMRERRERKPPGYLKNYLTQVVLIYIVTGVVFLLLAKKIWFSSHLLLIVVLYEALIWLIIFSHWSLSTLLKSTICLWCFKTLSISYLTASIVMRVLIIFGLGFTEPFKYHGRKMFNSIPISTYKIYHTFRRV